MQLLSVVAYLHERKVCHRNITPEHIILTDRYDCETERQEFTLKLVDLGHAADITNTPF